MFSPVAYVSVLVLNCVDAAVAVAVVRHDRREDLLRPRCLTDTDGRVGLATRRLSSLLMMEMS